MLNLKTIQFVSGLILIIIGIRYLASDVAQYFAGFGAIMWGAGSLLLAWLAKYGSDGQSRREQSLSILSLIGIGLFIAGIVLRK